MWKQLRKVGTSFLHLAYPPLCLHCREGLHNPGHLLCEPCLTLLALIHPGERCPVCFADENWADGQCEQCRSVPSLASGLAAAFDYIGPAATLVKQLKYSNKPYLAESLASYLVAQFCMLGWPMPDQVVPVPMSWIRLVSRGYNQSALLAAEVARLLGSRYSPILGRAIGDYSQAGLSREQRLHSVTNTLYLKRGADLYDQTVLLIDDVMTTGTTLARCAEVLFEGYPDKVYGITVCRAFKG